MSEGGAEEPEGDLCLTRPSVDGLEIKIVKDRDEPAIRIIFRDYFRPLRLTYSRADIRLEAVGPDVLEVSLQFESERPQWDEDRSRRRRGSRLLGQGVRAHGHPEGTPPRKVDEYVSQLFLPDRVRGDRSRAAPAVGRRGLGRQRRGEPLSAD